MMNQKDRMKCLIIGNDPLLAAQLNNYCKRVGKIQVIGICKDRTSALQKLKEHEVDLVIINRNWHRSKEWQFLNELIPFPTIILTAGSSNSSYDHKHVLTTQPLRYSQFIGIINQILEDSLKELPEEFRDHLYIKIDGALHRVDYDALMLIEARGDYIYLKTEEKNFLVHSTLKSIQSKLPSSRFIKVHRSYIVNRDKINEVDNNIIFINQNEIPISRSNRAFVLTVLNDF